MTGCVGIVRRRFAPQMEGTHSMVPNLKPAYLARYRDMVWLMIKYGRAELVDSIGLRELVKDDEDDLEKNAESTEQTDRATEFARDLESLGPTFVKLGQLLASRADLLPASYLKALSRLQDDVEPFAFEEVQRIVRDELGMDIKTAYAKFDVHPIAAASLGQVHRAQLLDGRDVVVKVQRPNVRSRIINDIEALDGMAKLLEEHVDTARKFHVRDFVKQFRRSMLAELDYSREAMNLERVAADLDDFEHIVFPKPVMPLTSDRVLTMDFMKGENLRRVSEDRMKQVDGMGLADELFHAYLRQVLDVGLFHADPHLGNVLLTDDNRIAMLDLGMVGRVNPTLQDHLLNLLLAAADGRAEDCVGITRRIGVEEDWFDAKLFHHEIVDLVSERVDANVRDMEIGRLVLEVTRISGECGMRMPAAMMVVGKMLVNLDEVGRELAPKFDPNQSIRKHSMDMMRRKVLRMIEPQQIFSTVVETKKFIERLPGRLDHLLNAAGDNRLRLRIDAIDEDRLIEGFQKIANRITVGLVLGSLILGAAILMNIETESTWTILGYPGLAMICFSFAAIIGFILVLDVMFSDKHR